ncbi:MAG: SpoIID/LytB domain-containing protein [Lachnospiraceae bacterium]
MKKKKLPREIKKYLLIAGVLVILVLFFTGKLFSSDQNEVPDMIANEELLILGTSESIDGLLPGEVYTDKGLYTYSEEIDMEAYVYESVQAVTEGKEIILINNLLERQVTLENRMVSESSPESLTIFADGYFITLPCVNLQESFEKVVADLYVAKGMVTRIATKKDFVEGKILSIRNEQIEVQGYGLLPVSEEFRFYDIYEEWKEKTISELIVGYDQTKLIVAEGQVCAAVLEEEMMLDTIRVLIKTTGFADIIHPSVTLTAHGNYQMIYGNQETWLGDGETLTITPDSEYLQEERIILTPESADNQLEISSIERSLGVPSYSGSMEISKNSGGMVLINELDLETYLYHVVPSEMPASYELEALKAQAVCARSYAYRQIQQNGYANYGAHVDDSVSYQVYNNLPTDEKVKQAVDETKGQVLKFGDDVATAYYFSTSCGYTTNETIWANGLTDNTYISGKLLNDSMQKLDLSEEGSFREFILNEPYETYDSGESWYRWDLTVPLEHLQASLASCGNVGEIRNIEVTKRNEGGVVQKVQVSGTKGSFEIELEYKIREALNGEGLTIKRTYGSDVTGGKMLPSGFFIIDPVKSEEGKLTGFRFRGGGFGHGAGMSQNGANHMAEAGKNYREILELFYTGTDLAKL